MVAVFLCSTHSIVSHIAATTTTTPVTVVSSASNTTMTATMAPTSIELVAALGQHDVVPLLPQNTVRGVLAHAFVLQ